MREAASCRTVITVIDAFHPNLLAFIPDRQAAEKLNGEILEIFGYIVELMPPIQRADHLVETIDNRLDTDIRLSFVIYAVRLIREWCIKLKAQNGWLDMYNSLLFRGFCLSSSMCLAGIKSITSSSTGCRLPFP